MSNNYNLSVNDFGKICRTCLAEGEISNGEMKLLFEKCPEEVCLIDMLMSINFVKFSEKDGLPVQICLNCVSEVTRVYKFAQKCSEVDEKLRKCLQEFMDSKSKSALFPTDTFDISDKQTPDLEDEMQIKTEIESDEHEIEVNPEIVLIKNEFLSDQEESYNKETNENIFEEKSDNVVNEGGNNSDFHLENDSESSVYESEEELKIEKRTENETKSKQPDLNRVNCTICSKSFSSTNIYVHMKIHFAENPFFCEFCGLEFITKKQLVVHRRTHTRCETCEKKFPTLHQLKLHMRVHSNEAPYVCDSCGKEFGARRFLVRHKRTHLEEKPYKCNVCEKAFAEATGLKVHMRTHTGEKPYSCETCEKKFTTLQQLKLHMQVHSGERPYVCDFCGRRFGTKRNLLRHKSTHTGERPHKCSVCERAFAHTSSLKLHMRIHTGERPAVCKHCGKSFTSNGNLNWHLRSHVKDDAEKETQ